MKPTFHAVLVAALAFAVPAKVWAELEAPTSVQAGAVLLLPVPSESHATTVAPTRIRDSLPAWDQMGAEKPAGYPYRLSADERKRMREQLRGQAPTYRVSPQ